MDRQDSVAMRHGDLLLTAIFRQGERFIIGQLVEIPGVISQGATIEECRENLRDALREYLLARRELSRSTSHDVLVEERILLSFPT